MKFATRFMLFICVCFLLLLGHACQTMDELTPQGSLVAHTGCLQTLAGSAAKFVPVTRECLRYQSRQGEVTLIHEGAVFNCAPGEIGGTVTIENDRIEIREHQSQAGAHCICPYNLDYALRDLQLSTYHLTLITYDNRTLALDIETAVGSEGEFCQDSPLPN